MKKVIALVLEGVLLFVGLTLATSQPAHAYLDPGTGSYALQVAIASLFGALFSLKMFWSKIKDVTIGRFVSLKVTDENPA